MNKRDTRERERERENYRLMWTFWWQLNFSELKCAMILLWSLRASVCVWILDGKVLHTTEVRKKNEWEYCVVRAGPRLSCRAFFGCEKDAKRQTGREGQKGVQGGYSAAGAKGRGWRFSSPSKGRPVKLRKEVRLRCVPMSSQVSLGNSCLDAPVPSPGHRLPIWCHAMVDWHTPR